MQRNALNAKECYGILGKLRDAKEGGGEAIMSSPSLETFRHPCFSVVNGVNRVNCFAPDKCARRHEKSGQTNKVYNHGNDGETQFLQ